MNDNPSHPGNLAEIIGQRLRQTDYDLIDVVAIPASLDRMARLRTLEEALQEFDTDENTEEFQQYLVQIKHKQKPAVSPVADPEIHQVYLHDGSLNIPFLFKNAELLRSSGESTLAKNIYLKIAQSSQSASHTGRALLALGICFENEGNLEEARDKFEQSITFQPTLEAYQRLSDLLIHQKKDRPAAEALERTLGLKDLPEKMRFDLYKSAGNCWMRANEMAAAERAFKKALEVEPTADEIQSSLGYLYLQAGKFNEARRKFQDTLASNPRNDRAITGLGLCLIQEGHKREAHDHFARSLEINLNNQQAVYQLVKCAYELKSYATAARIVESYIQVAPVNINLLYSLGGLQFHLGRMDNARATLNQILQLNPSHTGAKELLHRIDSLSCHGGQEHNGN